MSNITLANITVRIRGLWKVPVLGDWLKYVDVTRDLCSDPEEAVKEHVCPLPAGSDFYAKVSPARTC